LHNYLLPPAFRVTQITGLTQPTVDPTSQLHLLYFAPFSSSLESDSIAPVQQITQITQIFGTRVLNLCNLCNLWMESGVLGVNRWTDVGPPHVVGIGGGGIEAATGGDFARGD